MKPLFGELQREPPDYNLNATVADLANQVNKDTGWKPEIKFEKTLKDTLNYWRDYFKTVKIYHEK